MAPDPTKTCLARGGHVSEQLGSRRPKGRISFRVPLRASASCSQAVRVRADRYHALSAHQEPDGRLVISEFCHLRQNAIRCQPNGRTQLRGKALNTPTKTPL